MQNLKNKQKDIKETSFKELSLLRNMIFWVDIIPEEQSKRNAIFARPFNEKKAIATNRHICLQTGWSEITLFM